MKNAPGWLKPLLVLLVLVLVVVLGVVFWPRKTVTVPWELRGKVNYVNVQIIGEESVEAVAGLFDPEDESNLEGLSGMFRYGFGIDWVVSDYKRTEKRKEKRKEQGRLVTTSSSARYAPPDGLPSSELPAELVRRLREAQQENRLVLVRCEVERMSVSDFWPAVWKHAGREEGRPVAYRSADFEDKGPKRISVLLVVPPDVDSFRLLNNGNTMLTVNSVKRLEPFEFEEAADEREK